LTRGLALDGEVDLGICVVPVIWYVSVTSIDKQCGEFVAAAADFPPASFLNLCDSFVPSVSFLCLAKDKSVAHYPSL
jgi:hypothetical protein